MNNRLFFVLIFVTGLSLSDAAAEQQMFLSGDDFLSACSRPDPDWINFCHGYVQAAFDSAPNGEICPSSSTTRASLVGAVVQHLRAREEQRTLNAASVVRLVLRDAYPCR